MPFSRETVAQKFARMQADFKAEAPDLDPYLPRSVVFATLAALSAGLYELDGRMEQVARNRFADQADLDALLREGDFRGKPQLASSKSIGTIEFTGTDGTDVPTGTIVLIGENRFVTIFGPHTVVGGVVEVLVNSVQKGEAYNAPVGSSAVLEEPITGIDTASGTVTDTYSSDGITLGADDESEDDYRDRLLDWIRRPSQGGNLADWRRWIFESRVAHVDATWTRVFAVPPSVAGSNVMDLYAVDDALDPAGNAIAPAGAVYTAAETWIYDNRRPLTSGMTFAAPTLEALDPAITLVPNTTAVRAAVTEEIIQLLIREATIGGAIPTSHYDAAIARAAGLDDHTITSTVSDPVAAGALQVIGVPVFS